MRSGHRLGIAATLLFCRVLGPRTTVQTAGNQANPQQPQPQQEPLGDLARELRAKDTPVSTKRVWTTDDLGSPRDEPSSGENPTETTQESAEAAIRQFRSLDQSEIGAVVLKQANAPNGTFPDRKDWEQRLFDAKQAWIDQVAPLDAHRDANKYVQDEELRLADGAQRNFYRIANEGIERARAVNDPILKAHLEYQRRLDFCKSMTGDLYLRCVDGADTFKRQMQRDGSW